jgi:ATP-binding cassette subfamily B protein
LGLVALIAVDYLQLLIPELYQMVINGMIDGQVLQDGVMKTFDMQFLLYEICVPLW